MGNLPREASVTLLNTVSRGKKAIYHGQSSPCNRTYCRDKIGMIGVDVGEKVEIFRRVLTSST